MSKRLTGPSGEHVRPDEEGKMPLEGNEIASGIMNIPSGYHCPPSRTGLHERRL